MAIFHRRIFTVLTALSLSMISYANASDQVIFSCKTESGKTVSFINSGKTIKYNYSKLAHSPDLTFSVPRIASSIDDGSDTLGGGSWWLTQEINLKFNGNIYTGWWSLHRASGEEAAGIRVSRGNKILAETPCVSHIQMNLAAY